MFGPGASTEDIFDKVGAEIVESALSGINGTIFAYGQTSSGKTFTMNGDEKGDFPGILPLAAHHIFDRIERNTDNREYLVRVSFVEIYNEVVTDLLNPKAGAIRIRESRERGVFVESQEEIVTDIDALISVFERGGKSRHVGSTSMNERSSRSHTIFRITIESKACKEADQADDLDEELDDDDRRLSTASQTSVSSAASEDDDSGADAVLVATLSLVDLAGSENVRNTGAQGVRLREGGNINKSLLTLSGVIKSLSAAKGAASAHHRFRDSKLTRLLQPSLVGNCRTSIIACITAAVTHAEETRSTLRFAASAKTLTTRTKVNEVLDDAAMIKRLKRELRELKRGGHAAASGQLRSLENNNKRLEKEKEQMKLKNARVLEITRNLIAGGGRIRKQAGKENSKKGRKQKRRKKRETWCPSEMRANLGFGSVADDASGIIGTEGAGVKAAGGHLLEPILDESMDGGGDDSMDVSVDSINFLSAKKMPHYGAPSSSSMHSSISAGAVRRVSFGGMPAASHTIELGCDHRRVSFGDMPTRQDGAQSSIGGMVLRSKGAKIASQAERLRVLGQELADARKIMSEQAKAAEKADILAKEQASQLLLVKKVNDDQQGQISTLQKKVSEHDAVVSVLHDEKQSAVARADELAAALDDHQGKANHSHQESKERVDAAEAKVSSLEVSLASSQAQVATLTARVKALENEAGGLGEKVRAAEATYTAGAVEASEKAAARCRHLESTVESQASQLEALQEVIIANEMATDKVRSELQDARQERDALFARQEETRAAHVVKTKESLEKIAEITLARDALKDAISSARRSATTEIAVLGQRTGAKANDDPTLSDLKERIAVLEKEVEEHEEELADAVEESAEANEAKKTTEIALAESEANVAALRQELEIGKGQKDLLDDMVAKLDAKSKSVRSLREEIETLKKVASQSAETVSQAVADAQAEKDKVQAEADAQWVVKTNEAVAEAVAEAVENSAAEAKANVAAVREEAAAESAKLTDALETASTGQRKAEAELERAQVELAMLRTEAGASQIDAKHEESLNAATVVELEVKVAELEAKVAEQEAKVVAAKAEAEDIQAQAANAAREVETAAAAKVSEAEAALKVQSVKAEEIHAQMLEMQKALDESQASVLVELHAKTAEVEAQAAAKSASEVEAVKERFMTSIAALERKLATLKEENSEKASQVTRLMDKCEEGKAHEEAATKARSELHKVAEAHKEEVESLKRDMQRASDEMNAQLKVAEARELKLKEVHGELKAQISEMQDALDESARAQSCGVSGNGKVGEASSAAVAEQISAYETTISEQQVRIASLEKVKMTEKYLQKFRKIKNQNEKLREERKKIKVQMKEIVAQAKNKILAAESRAAAAEKKSFEVLAAGGKGKEGGGVGAASSTVAAKVAKKQAQDFKDMRIKLTEYYNKVKNMKKEQAKVEKIIKQCCPDAVAKLQKDAGLVTRVACFAEVHREMVQISEAEAQAVADMEERVNALQEQKAIELQKATANASGLEKEHVELRASYDKVVLDLKMLHSRCDEMSKTLAKRDDAAKRTQKENHARIRFLEKENLDLMMQAKSSQKENKKLAKALQNAAGVPEDKENVGNNNAVIETVRSRDKSAAKARSTRSSSRLAAVEAAAGSGHTMSETNELALMHELMGDDEALLGEDDACADDLEEDGEPECATQ